MAQLLISCYFNFDCIINNAQLYLTEYYYYKNLSNIVSDIINIDIEKYIKENGLPRNLYLYQNSIESLETIPFNLLFSLDQLHLFSNKITNIKFGNFIHLNELKELKLDKNEIRSFIWVLLTY